VNESDRSPITCPFCSSTDTELASIFGQQLLTAQYYCRACSTPFERVRDDDVLDDAARHIRVTRPER
jgi:DNA-directed RNA polymerase subunit RPC12/RpoP